MTTTISPSIGHSPAFTQGGTGASPGYDAIDFRRSAWFPPQEGVGIEAAWTVAQRAAGANMSVDIDAHVGPAWVQGDSISFQGRYMVAPHSALINETISAADGSLPRVDMVVLEVLDNVHDSSGSNLARTRIIAGTATSGATLNNRTGAASLPSSCLLLADVLVGAGATSITNGVIRDRRRWAFGAYRRIVRNANAAAGNDYTLASSQTLALLDATNVAPRIECTGVPVRVQMVGEGNASSALAMFWSPQVDSLGVDGMGDVGENAISNARDIFIGAGETLFHLEWTFIPSAGSHIIAPAVAQQSSGILVRAKAAIPMIWTVEEIVRQNVNNNATTTG